MLVGIGLIIGIPSALGLSKLISSFLYEVKAHDIVTFAAAPLVLSLVAVIASFRPARRALSLDPAQTLRAD
jgi:putative ABC transport system permease protein